MKNLLKFSAFLFGAALVLSSCGGGERSATTGWKYNDTKWGGYEKLDYDGQVAGPNLVLIEGGTFTMGLTEQDVTYDWNNIPRRVTVSSFYMDETEVSNTDYREYLYWIDRVFGESYPEVYRNALPDTLVWREELAFNEPFVETYLRHPSYDNYPVVGVSWVQATEYCKWRTDRVNEMILVEKGILNLNTEQKDEDNFVTESYLVGQYQGDVRKNLKDLRTGGERPVRFEDGIVMPDYRLPTEAEWEYAARGGEAGAKDAFLYSGSDDIDAVAWYSGNSDSRTHEVGQKQPNQLGLYDMSGNVWEWVGDCWHEDYKGASEDGSAWLEGNGGDCSRRVLRGGSWYDYSRFTRVALRFGVSAGDRFDDVVGFRLAREYVPTAGARICVVKAAQSVLAA